MRLSVLYLALAIAATVAQSAGRSAQLKPRYWIAALPTLGGQRSYPSAINNTGTIVGGAETGATDANNQPIAHACLWQNGEVTDLGTLGGPISFARAINDYGQVVGYSQLEAAPGNYYQAGFLWKDGLLIRINDASDAFSVNNLGDIAGTAVFPHGVGWREHPTLWTQGRSIALDFDLFCVNDSREVFGRFDAGRAFITGEGTAWQACVWSKGRRRLLPAAIHYDSLAIQSKRPGVAVGYSKGNAVVWHNRRLLRLGKSRFGSLAFGTNSLNQVVGVSYLDTNNFHAALWMGGQELDLNTAIPDGSGWVLQQAQDINNRGEIIGIGQLAGALHGFILTPEGSDGNLH